MLKAPVEVPSPGLPRISWRLGQIEHRLTTDKCKGCCASLKNERDFLEYRERVLMKHLTKHLLRFP